MFVSFITVIVNTHSVILVRVFLTLLFNLILHKLLHLFLEL